MAYLDASALIKRYSLESGTPFVNELFRRIPRRDCACFVIGIAEVISILVRKKNDGRLEKRLFSKTVAEFDVEFAEHEDVKVFSVNDSLVRSSTSLIIKHHINAVDAVMMRSVLDASRLLQKHDRDLLFVTSDKRLARAMQAEDVTVLDPEKDTLQNLREVLGSHYPSTPRKKETHG